MERLEFYMSKTPMFIVDSIYFLKFVQIDKMQYTENIKITLCNGILTSDQSDKVLYVHDSQNDSSVEYSFCTINKLIKILESLSEQPLTVNLSNFIELK